MFNFSGPLVLEVQNYSPGVNAWYNTPGTPSHTLKCSNNRELGSNYESRYITTDPKLHIEKKEEENQEGV